jgi:hypothetical protein
MKDETRFSALSVFNESAKNCCFPGFDTLMVSNVGNIVLMVSSEITY